MKPTIKGLLFDFDGVISSLITRVGWTFFWSLKSVRPNIKKEKVLESASQTLRYLHSLEKVTPLHVLKIILLISQVNNFNFFELMKFLIRGLTMYHKGKFTVQAEPGVEETLVLLSKEYKLGLVTSAEKKVIERAIEAIPAMKKFAVIVTREDCQKTKPNPEGIIKGVKALGLTNKSCLYIGDLPSDVIASKRAAVKIVSILGRFEKTMRKVLEPFNPDYMIPMVKDLPELLNEINKS